MPLKRLYSSEIGLDDRHIVRIRGHAHQAAEADMPELFGSTQDRLNLILCESTFGLLGAEMKLQQNVYNLAMLVPPLIYSFQKVQ